MQENRGQGVVARHALMPVTRKLRRKSKPNLSSTIPAHGPAVHQAAQEHAASDVVRSDEMAPQATAEIQPAPHHSTVHAQQQQQQQQRVPARLRSRRQQRTEPQRQSLESEVSTPTSTVSLPQPAISLSRLAAEHRRRPDAGRQSAASPKVLVVRPEAHEHAVASQQLLTGLCFAADQGTPLAGYACMLTNITCAIIIT